MMDVVLDSSIYRNDPKRAKNAFRALLRLCKGKIVRLHVPEFVRREFTSQQTQLLEADLKQIQKAATSLIRRSLSPNIAEHSTKILEEAERGLAAAGLYADEEFGDWLKESAAIEYGITLEHTRRVIQDYFNGAPPFTEVKHRVDIPDSFIFQLIVELAATVEHLYVIANDSALFKASANIPNISAFKELESFIETPECQLALEQLPSDAATSNLIRASKVLPKLKDSLLQMLEDDIVDVLVSETVFSREIPDDNGEGLIIMVGSPENVVFAFDQMEYYGGSEIAIPFTGTVECELNYAIFKADYYLLDEEKAERISISERNEHYYDADETYPIEVVGTLSVELDTEILENLKTTDDEIEQAILFGEHKVEITDKAISSEGERHR